MIKIERVAWTAVHKSGKIRDFSTRLMQYTIGCKTTPWDEATSPLASSRCRVLGRSPTGPELDALHISTGKKAHIE